MTLMLDVNHQNTIFKFNYIWLPFLQHSQETKMRLGEHYPAHDTTTMII